MPLYSLLIWAVVGGLIGWKGLSLLGKTSNYNPSLNIVSGLIGALFAGYIAAIMGAEVWLSVVIAVLGAIALLYFGNLMLNKKHTKQ